MLSASRYRRLAVVLACIVANVVVALYAVPALFMLSGLRWSDDDQASEDDRSRPTSVLVPSHASLSLLITDEANRGRRRWKQDELTSAYVLEPADAIEGNYCARSSPSSQNLLIVVCSAVENVDRRNAIRSTWGESSLLSTLGVRLVFVVARTDSTRSPPGIQRRVIAEHRNRNDVVQVDFVDDYVNLTAKTIAALRWAVRSCPRVHYVMKSDDDVYVDVAALTRRLEEERTTQISTFGVDDTSADAFIIGNVIDSARPVRDRRSKWYTPTSIFSEEFYPPYASGTGYVLAATVVHRLVALLNVRTAKPGVPSPFWLEDVYVTGMLAASLPDVRLVHDARFNYRPTGHVRRRPRLSGGGSVIGRRTDEDDEACAYRDAITVHDLTPSELVSLWRRLQSLRPLTSHCSDDADDKELMDNDEEELYSSNS